MRVVMRKESRFFSISAVLLPACLLLGLSVWMQPSVYKTDGARTWLVLTPQFAIRQGLAGALALALAFGIGRFLPARRVLRLWWVPLALLGLTAVAAPLSLWAGWGFRIDGFCWWQRLPGVAVTYLALFGGLTYAVPRFVRGERGGWPAFLGVLMCAALVPLTVLHRLPVLFILFGATGMCLLCTATGKRLWAGLGVMAAVTAATVFVLLCIRPDLTERFVYPGKFTAYQLQQSLFAVHCGELTGDRFHLAVIPEGHTDFLFVSLCGKGGLMAGAAVLLLVGALLALSWRIAARQRDLAARALASGCAALLTLRVALHVAVNLGLWPTGAVCFPFLSYGPLMLLFDGALLGLLVALDGGRESDEGSLPPRWLFRAILAGAGLLFILFVFRMFLLVYRSPALAQQRNWRVALIEQRKQKHEKPVRGRILDARGSVLAQQDQARDIFADPWFAAECREQRLFPVVARLLGLAPKDVAERLSDSKRRFVVLVKDAPEETVEAVRRLSLKWLGIQNEPVRRYPLDTPLAHLAGFVMTDRGSVTGAGGVECGQNALLRKGVDVRLTLDGQLQTVVQTAAEVVVRETGARRAQVVVMNPCSGAIRAAGQVPAFHGEKSRFVEERGALSWGAVADVCEPGGLVQPLVLASALDAGVIAEDSRVDCECGVWFYEGIPLRDPNPATDMTPEEILVRAGNIGMAKIGFELGEDRLYRTLVRWGVQTPLTVGKGMGGNVGSLGPPSKWSRIDITRLPIGHGLAMSLLQVCRAYTVFFNDGRMVEPRLVETGVEALPDSAPPILRPETVARVRRMLVRAVEEGTGRAARIAGTEVFGKTAVVPKPVSGGYDLTRMAVSFVGGFMADGEPVLIAVRLDGPRNPIPGQAAALFSTVGSRLITN